MLKLHIQDDEGKITVVPVVRDELSIGRKEGMTIRLTERNVSREHAFLKKENGTLYLEDLSARFGTKVNGSKLAGRTELLPGDVIQIGDYLLALHAEEGEDVTDPGDSGEGQGASVSDTGEFGPVPVTTQIIETGEAIASIAKEERARLVVVSRNLGGQESTIAHTPYTVGRTADNDFELAHRSVSSNHGVITYDGGSYTISDMDSANGVKINGDMYRKSDLHPGDEIEMGHVLLRFVGPNENFTFGERHFHTDDLLVADVAPSRMGRIAMIAVLVLAIVAATAWVMHFSKAPSQPSATAVADADLAAEAEQASAPEAVKPEKSAEAEAGTIKEPVVKVEPEPTVEPVVEPEPEPEPTVVKAKDKTPAPQPNEGVNPAKAKALAQQASQAMAAGDYGSAERSARAALKADKRNGRAAGILRKLLNEKRANSALTRAMSAKSTGKWANVLREAKKGLKVQAGATVTSALKGLEGEARYQLTQAAMMRGQGHAASGRHKAAIKEFKAALRYDSGNAQATTGLQRARAASRVRTQTTKVVKARKNPVTAGQNKLDAARALAKEAKAAKRASNLTLAEKLYRQCLKTHAGMASCRADLAVILMARSKRCEALKHMRKYVRSHPGSGKAIQFNRLIEQFEPQCN